MLNIQIPHNKLDESTFDNSIDLVMSLLSFSTNLHNFVFRNYTEINLGTHGTSGCRCLKRNAWPNININIIGNIKLRVLCVSFAKTCQS